jgi:hypothetical protein
MPSTYTANKSIEQPASGSYDDAWATPVNADWEIIDNAFGGLTTIALVSGTYEIQLTTAQYTPPNIELTGTQNGNVSLFIPGGVGGIWSIYYGATYDAGGMAVYCGTVPTPLGRGTPLSLVAGTRTLVICDGTNVDLAQEIPTNLNQLSGTVSNAQVPSSAVTQYQSAINSGVAIAGTQVTSGTIAAARIAAAGTLPGITIQSDPGTTPTGTYGQIFYYY